MPCLAIILHFFFSIIVSFFLPWPANDRFQAVDVQRDPAIPSSLLPTPRVFSPCLDANKEIDLLATRSPGC